MTILFYIVGYILVGVCGFIISRALDKNGIPFIATLAICGMFGWMVGVFVIGPMARMLSGQ